MPSTELAIVGAGPAGLAAATAAAAAGVAVTLLDEYPKLGGQYLKAATRFHAPPPLSATEKRGRALLARLTQQTITVRAGTLVWSIEAIPSEGEPKGFHLALHGPTGFDALEARTVIVATGARETVVPFPGWTLPGVLTLGASHLLAREHGVLPGRRVLLAGSGPLLFPALHALLECGAKIVGVLEATQLTQWVAHAPALWGQWERLREGGTYVKDMLRARVPYRPGHTVTRALGEERLEAAVVVPLDQEGRPLPGSEERVEIDALCLGFGFVPNVGLTQLAGCFHQYDPTRGGWVPVVNQRLETSLPNLFAAGETTGVDGAAAALLEGHVAGLAAAQRVGAVPMGRLEQEVVGLEAQWRRQRRFGTMFNTLYTPRPGLHALTTPDTPLCRCEKVTAGDVKAALRAGVRELDELKIHTRVGQGPCQGRTCGPLLAQFMARETGVSVEGLGSFHVRPPIKPVPLGAFNPEVQA